MDHPSRIAQVLRQAREQRGLTTEQAAADSGVPLRYARQLEGDLGAGIGISDELYLVPFFRRYAASLGMNAEQLLPDFLGHVQEVPGPLAPPAPLTYPARAARWWKHAATTLAVAAAALFIVRQSPERPAVDDGPWSETAVVEASAPDTVATAQPAATIDPAAVTNVSASAVPAGVTFTPGRIAHPAGETTAANAGSERAANSRELHVAAKEETWLSIGIDGGEKKEFLLRAGESHTWTANDAFSLTVGNAGGITVVLDGRELPPLGGSGQVLRNFRLPETEARDPSAR